MGQWAIPCSSVPQGKPQEGTVSLGALQPLSLHQTAPLLPLGQEGFEPQGELPPESRRGGQQLSLQVSLSAGIVF